MGGEERGALSRVGSSRAEGHLSSQRWHCLHSRAEGLRGAVGAAGWAPRILRLGPFPQLDQQKQGQALAHLRQRAETEVWETQRALDELLFKHQLQVSQAVAETLTHAHCLPTSPFLEEPVALGRWM